jgi:hypothetical protein
MQECDGMTCQGIKVGTGCAGLIQRCQRACPEQLCLKERYVLQFSMFLAAIHQQPAVCRELPGVN